VETPNGSRYRRNQRFLKDVTVSPKPQMEQLNPGTSKDTITGSQDTNDGITTPTAPPEVVPQRPVRNRRPTQRLIENIILA